jgi:hypothetical protein
MTRSVVKHPLRSGPRRALDDIDCALSPISHVSAYINPNHSWAPFSFRITAGMPSSTCKQRILCAFFQKRAIELQTAVIPGCPIERLGRSLARGYKVAALVG